MSRDFLTYKVGEDTLHAALDTPDMDTPDLDMRSVGLLIVSGGNEVRSGAFAGQAALAKDIALRGYPVFRFDRRGVGDSEGDNREFRSSEPDIRAAIAALRNACPSIQRIVGYGNCDGAASLMLASGAGCDALVLANPWTFDEGNEDAVPSEAARKRYAEKLSNPREWMRILKGDVSLSAIKDALKSSTARGEPMSALAKVLEQAMHGFTGHKRYLVAGRDRTGLAFKSMWPDHDNLEICPTADHAFSGVDETSWLEQQILSALEQEARQLDMG